jgi:hypothetical protein
MALFFCLTLPPRGHAMERWWPAHEADLIMIGTLRSFHSYPWLDGWRFSGTIDVGEVLYGSAPQSSFEVRDLVCHWGGVGGCDVRAIWNNRNFSEEFAHGPVIWLLKRGVEGTWYSSPGPLGAFAHDDLSKQAEYQDYIRRLKR